MLILPYFALVQNAANPFTFLDSNIAEDRQLVLNGSESMTRSWPWSKSPETILRDFPLFVDLVD